MRVGAYFGMTKLARLGLEMGTNPTSIDNEGYAPVHYAALAGNLDAMQLLIEYGADINSTTNSGHTALSLAIANGNIKVVQLLQAAGARPFEVRSRALDNLTTSSPNPALSQRLSLVVTVSERCRNCGQFTSHYIVCILSTLIFNFD